MCVRGSVTVKPQTFCIYTSIFNMNFTPIPSHFQLHSQSLSGQHMESSVRCSNQGVLIPGFEAHLVCNWPCCWKDDAAGLEARRSLSSIHPVWRALWGESSAARRGICLLSAAADQPCGSILCFEYKHPAVSARCRERVRGKRKGGMWLKF